MSVKILVQFTDVQAAALAEHKQRTDVPTACFIRRAVEHALAASKPSDVTHKPRLEDYFRPPVLISAKEVAQ